MLWYLLSPLRGTAQPPRLPPNHPIRRAFYRHGKTTAQHWLVAMLVSVAIAMAFSYPTIFLADNPTAGLSTFPRHVWTNAKPMNESETRADVEMRQIWVHGSYMHALDKEVLSQGLAIQQSIVGDDRMNGMASFRPGTSTSDPVRRGLHSPLMYWNNSQQLIDLDEDILKTINDRRGASSSLNVGLRPASVFAGKKFDRQRLLAADALVITFMNKFEEGDVGGAWQDRMHSLTHEACKDCKLFPEQGLVTRYQTYEFSFMPLSVQEHVMLTIAYSGMALYVLLSLRRIKAFHSRFGLVVTAITQMTCSILASFTICGILKINLAMIPQNAYPFVVLVLGVENMFRLINAVLAYPPTMATEMRIANALGDIGPISVAAAAQNLTILSLLSTVVSPGVAAFCAFAAIATLFDAFFLLTFFVAVLNVDIRRLELQDALATKHGQTRHRRGASPAQHTWFDALLQGRLPFSTRMAGTAVTTTFILSLNYHFFERREKATSLRDLLGLVGGGQSTLGELNVFAPPPMNASLTPGEWMRMQDFDTAKEVMRLAKPGGDSFTVRVYAPLVVVLSDSDRTAVAQAGAAWVHALRSFALHHFYPVAVAVVFAVAFVAVLMNFLLYNEAGDEENERDLEELDDSLVTHSVSLPHRLDIVKIAGSDNGHFCTVSLDRTIAVSIADRSRQTYRTVDVPTNILNRIQWPIRHLAIDESGEWIAFHEADDQISMYNHSTGESKAKAVQYPDDHPAVLFAFITLPGASGNQLHIIALSSGGRLVMSSRADGLQTQSVDMTDAPIVGASIFHNSGQGRQLVIATEQTELMSFLWNSNVRSWNKQATEKLRIATLFGVLDGSVGIELYPDLDADILMVTTSTLVALVNRHSLAHVGSLDLTGSGPFSSVMLLGLGARCTSCAGLAVRKVALLHEGLRQRGLGMTTWCADGDDDSYICLTQASAGCRSLEKAIQEHHQVSTPGSWTSLRSHVVLGLRRRSPQASGTAGGKDPMSSTHARRRRRAGRNTQSVEILEEWEAYRLSIDGDLETIEISTGSEASPSRDAALYVDTAGPVVTVDSQAVAVAFGNTVQVIRASRRGSVSRHSASTPLERQSSTSRKHVIARKTR